MTTPLDSLEGEVLLAVDELLGRASHDVAKYMAMTARNVSPNDLDEELRSFLRRDLTQTDGEQPAWVLWERFASELGVLSDEPDLEGIEGGMAELRGLYRRWSEGQPLDEQLIGKTIAVSDAIRALRRAVRRRLEEVRECR